MVVIFGKDHCPYTRAAREHYDRQGATYEYVDVKQDRAGLDRMLSFSGGRRSVPVIVDNGEVTVGFGGT